MPGLKEKCIQCGKEFDLTKDDYIKGRKLCDECTEAVLKKIPPVWLVRLIAVVVTLGGCAISFLPFVLGSTPSVVQFLLGLTIAGVGLVAVTFSFAMTGFKE
ncbi:MAG: hypothetical protein IJO45_04995 [Oscillospiraceae bacterium]|nr:hypothetical protein [Oscillospiraceae bacterium]